VVSLIAYVQLDNIEWWSEQNKQGSVYVQFWIDTPRLCSFKLTKLKILKNWNLVELHLSGLIWTASRPDMRAV
jgi:hypothetical protein